MFASAAFLVALLDDGSAGDFEGPAEVTDGDTLTIRGTRIRLSGIDAPELDQICHIAGAPYACGLEARRYLVELIGGDAIRCRGSAEDRYGRLLAYCVRAGIDLNSAIVQAGWAVSFGYYRDEERLAREAGAGLWAGSFVQPAEWRAAHGDLPHGRWSEMASTIIHDAAAMLNGLWARVHK